MKSKTFLLLGFFAIALASILIVAGCCEKGCAGRSPGPAEKAGKALDKAFDSTSDEARETADKVIKKSGELLEKAEDGLNEAVDDL